MKLCITPRRSGSGAAFLFTLLFLGPLTLLAGSVPVIDTLPKRTRPLVNNARLPQPLRDTGVQPPAFKILPFTQLKADAKNWKRAQLASPLITTGKTNPGNAMHKSGLLFTTRQLVEMKTKSVLNLYMALLDHFLINGIQMGYPVPATLYHNVITDNAGKPMPQATLAMKDLPTTPRLYLVTVASTFKPEWLRVEASNENGSWKREFRGADLLSNAEGKEIRFLVPFPAIVAGEHDEFSLILSFYYNPPKEWQGVNYFSHLQWIQLD